MSAEPHRHTHRPHAHASRHGHEHGNRGHRHAPEVGAGNERRVLWAFALTAGFMLAEVAGGLWSGSLALLADAGHMLTDAASLALAWAAFRVARRPHDRRRSYGYHRVQVLAAFVNGLALVGIVGWIAIEAVLRLFQPVPVLAGPMLVIAVLGLAVNVVAFAVLRGGAEANMNLKGAALHVLGDLFGSIATIAAAAVIMASGWTPVDPLLSLLVALLVLRSAWQLTRHAGHVLLEGAPDWLDEAALKATLVEAVPAVASVHHVHVWMLTPERPLMTLHVVVHEGADPTATLAAVNEVLKARYAIDHATIQLEREICADGG